MSTDLSPSEMLNTYLLPSNEAALYDIQSWRVIINAHQRFAFLWVDPGVTWGTTEMAAPHIWVPKLCLPAAAAIGAAAAIVKNPEITRRFWAGWSTA